jgi:hypothetical protein
MSEKIKAQICFAGNANIENVKKQLEQLKAETKYQFYCCFLPKHLVEQKGFSPEIVDTLEEVLGEELVWQLKEYETFEAAMANIEQIRQDTAELVNRMFVLDSGTAAGVAKEVQLFTNAKVILMP